MCNNCQDCPLKYDISELKELALELRKKRAIEFYKKSDKANGTRNSKTRSKTV